MADTSTAVLVLRVALSLACVLGIIWYANRRLAGSAAVRRQRAATMAVVGRQSLGGKNGLALVDVAGRRLLLGTGDHGVTLLTEIDLPPAEDSDGAAGAPGTPRTERVPLTAAELEDLALPDLSDLPDLTDLPDLPDLPDTADPAHLPAPKNPAQTLTSSTPAARMPAVTEPRHPLDGSILAASTWRRAVVAVQERTIRR